MADMMKPQQNAPRPPSKGHKGKVVGVIVVLGLASAVYWNGRKIGEEREEALAKKEGRAPDMTKAGFVPPWDWTTRETKEVGQNVKEGAQDLGEAAKAKVAALRKRIDDWNAERAKAAPVGVPPAPAPPATAPPATPNAPPAAEPPSAPTAPPVDAAAPPPPGLEAAAALVNEGNALWQQNKLKDARSKLVEAQKLLEPLAAQTPVHPMVEKTQKLCKDLIEDIDSR